MIHLTNASSKEDNKSVTNNFSDVTGKYFGYYRRYGTAFNPRDYRKEKKKHVNNSARYSR